MAKQKRKTKDQKALENVMEGFNASWNYARNTYHDTWLDCWKLYNNQRIDRAYKGISDSFDPMVFSTVETMVAAIAGSRPRFNFQPTKEEQEQDTEILNSMMDFYWDADKWQSKVDKWLRSSIMYGTGVVYVWWDIDRPRMINVPLRDFFIDPNASTMDGAAYVGRRYLTTKKELESFEVIDPETGEMKPRYKNLDKIARMGERDGEGENTDKEEKEMFLGSTLGKDAKESQVEVIEYWTKDKFCVIANRGTVIANEDNIYKEAQRLTGNTEPEGLLPFVAQRNYQDESLFYGKGEIEPIKSLQEDLNDLNNQLKDATTYAVNPMYTIDPGVSFPVEEFESLPGASYEAVGGAIERINMGDVSVAAFNEREIIKNTIRETTASDQVVKGVQSDTKTTATEINAQLNQANQRMALKISQVENEGYHDLANIVMSMVDIFVTEPQMIKVIGREGGINWEVYDPNLNAGEYEPSIQLQATIDAQKAEEQSVNQEMYLAFREDPGINQQELKRMTFQKVYNLDPDEIDALLDTQPELEAPEEQLDLTSILGGS